MRSRGAAVAVCLLVGAATASPAAAQMSVPPPPSIDELGKRPVPSMRDSAPRSVSRARASQLRRSTYRRSYRAYTGEEVNVVVSGAFAQDDAYKRRWADYLAGLVHGSELQRATVFLASAAEKSSLCSPDPQVTACYVPFGGPYPQMLVINLQPAPESAAFTEEFAAHEYGHHVAWNRDNSPWSAYDYGTKRWASYENVCRRTRRGSAFPGDPSHYSLDPGEAFADQYRVTTGGNPNLVARADIDASFYPPTSLDRRLIIRDVKYPWRRNTVRPWRGRLRRGTAARTFRTHLDGDLRVSVTGRRGTNLDLYLKSGRRTVKRAARRGNDRLTYRVCGTNRIKVVVKRRGGRGRGFRVRFSRP